MPARILDGKALALKVRQDVTAEVARLEDETGMVPGLTVVLVGDNPASQVYVRNKQNACKAAGMHGQVLRISAEISQVDLLGT
ncbi:MAG TPA: tetrahydrofolate dehydrogenase/cyclohydrolase catalytic domain-containing protein, partial [Isosphaeraceae bacterium]|nr:tetrahydrofolate dehydrogenase/cyclohydrolase catalytic domain-containing protein [Isosphaeraceae bacterium]